jgi:hypothetical protein
MEWPGCRCPQLVKIAAVHSGRNAEKLNTSLIQAEAGTDCFF